MQAESKIKARDQSLKEAKDEQDNLQTQIDGLKEQKSQSQTEYAKICEKLKESEQQIDRFTKKEEMNGHLKAEYEEEVQKLRKESTLQKEQYRKTFD